MTGPRPDEPQREILTVDEAAALLCVSLKTFQKVLRTGDVPGRKIGREWKFSRRALIEWVGRGRAADFLDVDDQAEEPRAEPRLEPRDVPGRGVARDGLARPRAPHPQQQPAARKRAEHEMAFEED